MSDPFDKYWRIINDQQKQKDIREMADIQRRVQGQVELHGVNIKGDRVGHDDRRRTVQHIKDMEAKGYIPPEEATARIEHATESQTRHELRHLTEDLPAPIHQPGYWKGWDYSEPKYFIPVLLTGMFGSLCAAVAPGVILGAMHQFNTVAGQAVFIPLIILGVLGFILSLVLLVIQSSE